jgi:hypothetical protein
MQSFNVLKQVVHIVTTGLYDEELHAFITSALDVSGHVHAPAALPTRKGFPIPIR